MLLKAKGQLDDAEDVLKETLHEKRAALGERHPSTLISMNNLGKLFEAKGRDDEAEGLYRDVLQARAPFR